jgi:acyl carrier protein
VVVFLCLDHAVAFGAPLNSGVMPHEPTTEEVAEFVRRFAGISSDRSIGADTKIDDDLDLTGMDGIALLQAIEEHFGVVLMTDENGVRDAFDLGPNEYLFGSEGLDLLGVSKLIRLVKGEPDPIVRDLTIEELRRAIRRASTRKGDRAG